MVEFDEDLLKIWEFIVCEDLPKERHEKVEVIFWGVASNLGFQDHQKNHWPIC